MSFQRKLESTDTEVLFAFAIGKPREFVLTHPEYKPSLWQKIRFKYYLWLRRRGWPIAYITGHKEFFGLDFLVNKHTLVPRPETELMVEECLRLIKEGCHSGSRAGMTIIDVGTGSGCVPIAIAKQLPLLQGEGRGVGLVAIDISRSALRVAKKNAKKHGVKIKFLRGNLLEPLYPSLYPSPTRGGARGGVIITANLPYLTAEQFAGEPSIRKEPRSALVADDKNGLSLYERLLSQLSFQPSPKGASWNPDNVDSRLRGNDKEMDSGSKPGMTTTVGMTILLEIDPRQKNDIIALIKKYLPQAGVEIKTDLAGRDRLVIITM